MQIKVAGPGCKKCDALEKAVKEAVAELGIDAEVLKITDLDQIVDEGIMMTPGLIINGKVKSSGKALKKDKVKKMLQEEM